jgi:glycosyltransferase involved in cell wall biosynthesis
LGAVADWLVRRRGYRCQFYCASAEPRASHFAALGHGLEVVPFSVGGVARDQAVGWTRLLERRLCYDFGCWEALQARRPWPVDVVLGRSSGLGSTLFTPVFQPRVPIVNLFDYYYHAHAHDLSEMPDHVGDAEYFYWRRAANAIDLIDLENGVVPWTTTRWQQSLFPVEYRNEFLVLHDGIDTRRLVRRPGEPRQVAGRTIPANTKVVSFVAKNLELLRGFDRFAKLASRLLQARSDVICVAIGGGPVQRGLDTRFYGRDFRDHVMRQTRSMPMERFWCLGSVDPGVVAELLAQSDLHVYPSRPFVVSRSLLEAMAAECVVLAADSAPVREFIAHEHTGLLVEADDADAWERHALAVLDDATTYRPLAAAAAELVQGQYGQDVVLPRLAETLNELTVRCR